MRPWVGIACVVPSALVGSLWGGEGLGGFQSILSSNSGVGLFAGLDVAGLNCFNF